MFVRESLLIESSERILNQLRVVGKEASRRQNVWVQLAKESNVSGHRVWRYEKLETTQMRYLSELAREMFSVLIALDR